MLPARAPRAAPSFQLQILLQAGHDANALDMHKATPLHRAAASGSTHTVTARFPPPLFNHGTAASSLPWQVSLLIKAGARLDAVDKFGATAHGWAVKYGPPPPALCFCNNLNMYGHAHLLQALQPHAV